MDEFLAVDGGKESGAVFIDRSERWEEVAQCCENKNVVIAVPPSDIMRWFVRVPNLPLPQIKEIAEFERRQAGPPYNSWPWKYETGFRAPTGIDLFMSALNPETIKEYKRFCRGAKNLGYVTYEDALTHLVAPPQKDRTNLILYLDQENSLFMVTDEQGSYWSRELSAAGMTHPEVWETNIIESYTLFSRIFSTDNQDIYVLGENISLNKYIAKCVSRKLNGEAVSTCYPVARQIEPRSVPVGLEIEVGAAYAAIDLETNLIKN